MSEERDRGAGDAAAALHTGNDGHFEAMRPTGRQQKRIPLLVKLGL